MARQRAWSSPAAVGVVVAITGGVVRAWARAGAAPLIWNDSADYLASSRTGLVGLDRLAGIRPVLTPLVLSLARSDVRNLAVVQATVAAVAWGLLAAAVGASMRSGWRRWAAGLAILWISVAWPVAMWDQQVLTESLALSMFVLAVAAALAFARRCDALHAALLVVAAALWLLARDSHVVPVALGGLLLLLAAARSDDLRRLLLVTGAYLLALSFLVAGAAHHGRRAALPTEHVYAARVLPYSGRVAWFAAHGMPDARTMERLPEAVDPRGRAAPYTPIGPDPRYRRWRRWVADHGQAALAAYVVSHPGYLWDEPGHHPPHVFNDAGRLQGYRPLALRDVPGTAAAFSIPTPAVVLAAGASLGIALARRRRWGPLEAVGAFLVVSAGPHALVVWHTDGMEASRHLLLPAVQLRTGSLLLVIAALLGGAATQTEPEVREPVEGQDDAAPVPA